MLASACSTAPTAPGASPSSTIRLPAPASYDVARGNERGLDHRARLPDCREVQDRSMKLRLGLPGSLLGEPAIGHVLDHAQHLQGAVAVAEPTGREPGDDSPPVARSVEADLDGRARDLAAQQPADQPVGGADIVAMHELLESPAHQRALRRCERPAEGAVRANPAEIASDHAHPDRAALEHAAEAVDALTKGALLERPLGLVAGDHRDAGHLAIRVPDGRNGRGRRDQRPISSPRVDVEVADLGAPACAGKRRGEIGNALGRHEVGHHPSDDLVRPVPEQRLGGGVPAGDDLLRRERDDRVVGRAHEGRKMADVRQRGRELLDHPGGANRRADVPRKLLEEPQVMLAEPAIVDAATHGDGPDHAPIAAHLHDHAVRDPTVGVSIRMPRRAAVMEDDAARVQRDLGEHAAEAFGRGWRQCLACARPPHDRPHRPPGPVVDQDLRALRVEHLAGPFEK